MGKRSSSRTTPSRSLKTEARGRVEGGRKFKGADASGWSPAGRPLDTGRLMLLIATAVILGLMVIFTTQVVRQRGGAGATNPMASPSLQARAQNLKDQISRLEATLRVNPSNLEALISLGNARYDLGAVYLFEMGWTEEGRREFGQAVDTYRQALEQDPRNVDVRVDMATAAFYCSQNEVARQGFERAIADNPRHINAHLNFGVFLVEALNDKVAAVEQWKAVLALNPEPEIRDRANELIKQAQGGTGGTGK